MKLALLTGVAAMLSLLGPTGTRAETIYLREPAQEPAYVVTVPADPPAVVVEAPIVETAPIPVVPRGYVVTDAPAIVVDQAQAYVIAPRAVPRPGFRYRYTDTGGVIAARTPCVIDANGFERCY